MVASWALLLFLVLPGPETLRLRQCNGQRQSSSPLPKTHREAEVAIKALVLGVVVIAVHPGAHAKKALKSQEHLPVDYSTIG
jgi:hypothetical protein